MTEIGHIERKAGELRNAPERREDGRNEYPHRKKDG